jgi:hypothetical protein
MFGVLVIHFMFLERAQFEWLDTPTFRRQMETKNAYETVSDERSKRSQAKKDSSLTLMPKPPKRPTNSNAI